ncbi:Nucleoporin NUP37 [Cytospora mali]|uniref:Nucleoporin NUP37 n=1 Tax=Cytospora mali TaxID=578113 RepID=A0A194UXS0_CYTMA|nr:Nucleoporin NUP37 [Valsa mali var. pyri (nom. inval.)]
MTVQMKPRVRQTAQNTQYTYNLNRRIHDVKTYPILSPQGSTILLYGHENGVTVLWRGGRRLKPAKPQSSKSKATSKPNGSSSTPDDAVMILDSDDEDDTKSASAPFDDRPEFEKDNVEDTTGYAEVIQTLDLSLGADVLHIAVLPIAPRTAGEASKEYDNDILAERMVFAVTCATGYVYMITLPLTPPSHDSKAREELRSDLLAASAGKGKWGETLISLNAQRGSADGIAISLAPRGSSNRNQSPARRTTSDTRVIIAVHGRDASGTLRLWDVPVNSSTDTPPIDPFQTEYLPSPLTGIVFSPLHPTQLLAVASPHAVRIYDYSNPSIPHDDDYESRWPLHGSWLLSLYPPFARGTGSSCSRKPIVGANWISHGRSILTLLADGQWGIWDVEGAGPLGNDGSNSLFGKQNTGIRGAALTAFSASGFLEGTSPLRNPGAQKTGFGISDFNPVARRDSLLTMMSGGPGRLAAVQGGVEVIQLPSARGLGSVDESAVLWIGGPDSIVCVIPVVAKFWDAQVRRSAGGGVNLFSGAQPSRMVRLTELSAGLLGEQCCGLGAVPKSQRRSPVHNPKDPDGKVEESTGLPVEVIIRGESRLVVVHDFQDVETAPLRFPTQKLKKLAPATEEHVNAIIVHPRPDKPAKAFQSFDLSIRPGARDSVRAPSVQLFSQSFSQPLDAVETEPTDYHHEPMEPTSRPNNMGLEFMDDLDAAADAGYEVDAEERDVEQEVLDLMELDQQLEQMEDERSRGTKRVFFEED